MNDTLNIMVCGWDDQAESFLAPACNSEYTVMDLKNDVQAKTCSLYNVYHGGNHIASMVLRLDCMPNNQTELVVVALGGCRYGGGVIQALNSFWNDLAKSNSARTIRAHVSKKGMARLMERAGGKLSEYVYKREVV